MLLRDGRGAGRVWALGTWALSCVLAAGFDTVKERMAVISLSWGVVLVVIFVGVLWALSQVAD